MSDALYTRVGEYHRSFKTAPQIIAWVYKIPTIKKNSKKMLVNGFRLDLKFFYCPLLNPKVC